MITIYSSAQNDYKKVSKLISINEEKLKALPKGRIYSIREQNHTKWYYDNGKKKSYLKKSNLSYARQLALKRYLLSELKSLKQKQKALEHFLKNYPPYEDYENLIKDSSPYRELLLPYLIPLDEELSKWENDPFPKYDNHLESLIHYTPKGHYVRSKSEAIIATALFKNKIPYHYEEELILDGITLHPDFTIRHPKNGEKRYWEHWGLMDDPDYSHNYINKHNLYIENGFIPTINLICTYETKLCPLSPMMVDEIIRLNFS